MRMRRRNDLPKTKIPVSFKVRHYHQQKKGYVEQIGELSFGATKENSNDGGAVAKRSKALIVRENNQNIG